MKGIIDAYPSTSGSARSVAAECGMIVDGNHTADAVEAQLSS